jgi:hypothetical protein
VWTAGAVPYTARAIGISRRVDQVELESLFDDTLKGLGRNTTPPAGFQKIRMIRVSDCKQDFRHNARMVAGGPDTPPAYDSESRFA